MSGNRRQGTAASAAAGNSPPCRSRSRVDRCLRNRPSPDPAETIGGQGEGTRGRWEAARPQRGAIMIERLPTLLIGVIVMIYWGRVLRSGEKSRRVCGHSANFIPGEIVGKLTRVVWIPVTAIWIVLPFVTALGHMQPVVASAAVFDRGDQLDGGGLALVGAWVEAGFAGRSWDGRGGWESIRRQHAACHDGIIFAGPASDLCSVVATDSFARP